MKVKEHPKAKIEVRNHFDYYLSKSVATAEKFNQAYIATVKHICKYPTINPIAIQDKRWRRISSFPHKIIYEHNETNLNIIAVIHEKQKPFYWKERKFS